MKVPRCKGTQDLSPAGMTKFRRVESVFRDSCLKWGYEEVRTPTLEYLHLFTSAGTLTPGMLHKVYSFLDWDGWSGERVVLRPDVTIPVARYYVDCMEDKGLAKLFYVANVFRFEGTGTEARERWQCGAELIGAGSPAADVELIVLALDVLKRLGVGGVELRLSHAGLIREVMTRLGVSPEELARASDRNGGALADIKPSGGVNSNLVALLGMKGKSSGMLKNLKTVIAPTMPELVPALDNFISIVELVAAMGYNYQIDIDSGRGFEYYTGMIFQLFAGATKIGGGGRYDALIPVLGGKNIPASGYAFFVDRLMDLLPPQETGLPRKILIQAEPEAIKEGFSIATHLHSAGYVAEIDAGADKTGFRWLLGVRNQPPVFVLTDQVGGKRFTASAASEIIAILGEQSASKNSPA